MDHRTSLFESSLLETEKKRTYAYSRFPLSLHETQSWQFHKCEVKLAFVESHDSSPFFNTLPAHRSTFYHQFKSFVFLPGTRFRPIESGTCEDDRIPGPVWARRVDFNYGSFYLVLKLRCFIFKDS